MRLQQISYLGGSGSSSSRQGVPAPPFLEDHDQPRESGCTGKAPLVMTLPKITAISEVSDEAFEKDEGSRASWHVHFPAGK